MSSVDWFCGKCGGFFEEPDQITIWLDKTEHQLSVCPYCQGYFISRTPVGIVNDPCYDTSHIKNEANES